MILVEVHRNPKAFDFLKNILIKIQKNISGAKILIDVNAYVELTFLNLEEKMTIV